MPSSLNIFNEVVYNHVKLIEPGSHLDVGSGSGKYLDLVKSAVSNVTSFSVEPYLPYIQQYNLRSRCKEVFNTTASDFFTTNNTLKVDLITMGDVLEHMFLNEALNVIDAACFKSKFIIAVWPTNLPQDVETNVLEEMHKCNLLLSDVSRFNLLNYEKRFFGINPNGTPCYMHYALIAGHLTSPANELYRLKFNYWK